MPAADIYDGRAVRLRQGESGSETDCGSSFEAARIWVEVDAEWTHLVDLNTAFSTGSNRDQLREVAHELDDRANIELSDGAHDDASLGTALKAGTARVSISTATLKSPDWITPVIKKYGDHVAVGLDVHDHTLVTRGWMREGGGLFETMRFLDPMGCSRYVVVDVAKDGMMSDPNIQLLSEIAERIGTKVVASGDISRLDDLRVIKELAEIDVDSAILGESLCARAFTLREALEVAKWAKDSPQRDC